MSTRIGTLQAPRADRAIWAAAFVAVLVMLTVAVVAISMDREVTRQRVVPAVVSGTAANTPTEIRAAQVGAAQGTLANTPTEIRAAGADRAPIIVPHVPRRAPETGQLGTNTPSEMSGGLERNFERRRI